MEFCEIGVGLIGKGVGGVRIDSIQLGTNALQVAISVPLTC